MSRLILVFAQHIGAAFSNIVAYNEIQQSDEEKSKILAFSNAISSIRNKNALAKMLKQQLNDRFSIDDYVIHIFSENKKTHTPILFDSDSEFARHPEFAKLIGNQNDVNDGFFNLVINSDEPIIINTDDWDSLKARSSYLEVAREIGIKEIVGVSIGYGDENIAVMNFRRKNHGQIKDQYNLFKSILKQIAIAVSNIVANEKIANQLREINKFKQQLEDEKIYLTEEIETTHHYSEIIGESVAVHKTFKLVAQVSASDSTVLLLGETGTGKELIARAIHNNSPRKGKLMVKVNCAALPVNLIESELFGHERGSFTGATERRLGKFELANGGTLFLDEIGEMPLDLQVKLLRVLQEKEIERIGGKNTIKVDVRIIAATNRDLAFEMAEGRFRRDLYYRLNTFPIYLSPLRERREDIALLATHFIQRFAKKAGRKINTLSSKALQELMEYDWPGNIRELEHLIERSVLQASGDTIKQIHLPTPRESMTLMPKKDEFNVKTIDENERDHILNMLKYSKGRIAGEGGAADLLGVPPTTLNSKIKRLGIKREHVK